MHWFKLIASVVGASVAGGCGSLAGRATYRLGGTRVTVGGDGTGNVTVDVEGPRVGGSVTIPLPVRTAAAPIVAADAKPNGGA